MADPIRFSSQFSAYRMIRRPTEQRLLPNGNLTTVAAEVVLEFKDHMFETAKGRNVMCDLWDPDANDFVNQDELSWLRGHQDFGFAFHEIPVEVPASAPAFAEIARLAAHGDRDGLMALGRKEADGFQREDVLELCKEAVQSMPEKVPVKA